MTESRSLVEVFGDSMHDEPTMPLVVVTMQSALDYIAFGRIEGPWRDMTWFNLTPARREQHAHELHGARCAAQRVLIKALKHGHVAAYSAEDADQEIEHLWRYGTHVWRGAVGIYGTAETGYSLYADDLHVKEPVFSLEEVLALAEPADEVLHVAEVKPKARGGRPAGTNGAPLAGFIRRLEEQGQSVVSETQETLGAWLREEYAKRGLNEPNPDNAKRDAVGALRDWFGLTAEG